MLQCCSLNLEWPVFVDPIGLLAEISFINPHKVELFLH